MGTFDITRPMIGMIGVGIARAALEEAHRYAHERIQFGEPIINFRGLQEMFVDMTVTVEAARALVLNVSRLIDNAKAVKSKKDITGLSGVAKVIGSEAGRISLDALQATGGYGYMNETPFPKLVRDFKIFEIFEGTNQIQREQVSLQLIKEFGKGNWENASIREAEEALAKSPHCGAAGVALLRRTFAAYLGLALPKDASRITADQYIRFILADILIELETAHAYSVAASRLEEPDPNDFTNLCARIYASETVLRNAARLRRLILGTTDAGDIEKVEEQIALRALDTHGATLLEDRKVLGAWLCENRLS